VERFVPVCDSALAAIDFADLLDVELLKTRDALDATEPEVFSFFAMVSPKDIGGENIVKTEKPHP
jgi:hypothetical protein